MKALITGGAGYIGSHVAATLLESGYEVTICDNYSNSDPSTIDFIKQITGKSITSYKLDCTDLASVIKLMDKEKPDCVMHMAGYKAVAESITNPLKYYRNNLLSSITVLEAMKHCSVHRIVFSSSAAVYDMNDLPPYSDDTSATCSISPYGKSKLMIEHMLKDAAYAVDDFSAVSLRYFNPVGAHPSALIGDVSSVTSDQLMSKIVHAASHNETLTIYGSDYNTPDGTCRRDFIHIMDLARGHVCAADYLMNHRGFEIINLGTGHPFSVLEMINTFNHTCKTNIKYQFGPRRQGDNPESWTNPAKAKQLFGWEAKLDLSMMCIDSWNRHLKSAK